MLQFWKNIDDLAIIEMIAAGAEQSKDDLFNNEFFKGQVMCFHCVIAILSKNLKSFNDLFIYEE